MKKLFLFLALTCSISASAQLKYVQNLYFGFSPIGGNNIKVSEHEGEPDLKFSYKSNWNATICWEKQRNGFYNMFEASFGRGKLDNIDYDGQFTSDITTMISQGDDVMNFSAAYFFGIPFLKRNGRFQLPLYIGPGVDYKNGGTFHHFMPFVGVKMRFIAYVTYKSGVWIGGNYNLECLGYKKVGENSYSLTADRTYIDAGLVIQL